MNRILLSLLSFFFLLSCDTNNNDDVFETHDAVFQLSEGTKFMIMDEHFVPSISLDYDAGRKLKGKMQINHSENYSVYSIDDLGLKYDDKTTINNFSIRIDNAEIGLIRSKDIDAGFCGGDAEIQDRGNNSITVNFLERENNAIGFAQGSSKDTCRIYIAGTIEINPASSAE